MAAELGKTTSRTLNRLAYDLANAEHSADIGTVASGDRIPIYDASAELVGYTTVPGLAATMTKGSGVSAAETYASSVAMAGTLKTTRIMVDLTGLVGSATDLDIIGNTTQAANAHFGQITAAINGTIVGGQVTCLEVPAGGTADIDFYSATVGTGAQDTDVTTLTETALVTSGGNWTTGTSKGMTTVPPANDYLYICNGAASGGTFTAGKFLIELFGV